MPPSLTGSAYSPQRRTAIVFTGTGVAGNFIAKLSDGTNAVDLTMDAAD